MHTGTKHQEVGDLPLYIKNTQKMYVVYRGIIKCKWPKNILNSCITVYENTKYK